MRRTILHLSCCLLLVVSLMCINGCVVKDTDTEKLYDIEYTVISLDELPSEVVELIKDNEKKKMMLTYTDKGVTYIIRGYGRQSTSGYSIEILSLYETETAIWIETNLLGPGKKEEIKTVETYPYIVVQITESEKPVMFTGAN